MTDDGPRILVDGHPLAYESGDSVALAILRAGEQPRHGGTLCLAGDCPHCVAEVDGVAYVRTCQTVARPGLVVRRHPRAGAPGLASGAPAPRAIAVERRSADVVVVGRGDSGRRARDLAIRAGREVLLLDASDGFEVVGVYRGPLLVARSPAGMLHVRCREVVIATGAAELHPVCPGNDLAGIVTRRAAERLHAAGIDLGQAVAVGIPPNGVPCTVLRGELVSIEDDGSAAGRVGGAVTDVEGFVPCDTLVVGSGSAPRDVLARMTDDPGVRVVGLAAEPFALPSPPVAGIVCPCSGTTVEDLDGVWSRGFHELELMKRASLAGTGTCQGSVCVPHLRAFVAHRTGDVPAPFTARPASRQVTLAEAAAGHHFEPVRRTALHDEHVRLGAQMDRFGGWWRPWHYGDHVAEYWAVRNGVSLGDVSTLGKILVRGPDVVELLERLYPTRIGDLRVGRARYVLLLNERGHVIDDGMVCREAEQQFLLTFTSGGAAAAEMWIRDWIDAWDLRVHVLDRTMSLGAINVTGPLAPLLLGAVGIETIPRFLHHVHAAVATVPCHVIRLSFTGETSFELHHPVDRSVELWRALMAAGSDLGVGIAPHGLQALFGLRLEKGHVIVGMDTELDSTPRRLGMDWAVAMDKPDFIGRTALARTSRLAESRRLVPLRADAPAPVEGSPISAAGEIVGHVTSSFASPTLGHAVMLGWLKRPPFTEVVEIDGRPATVTRAPFYDVEGRRARA